MQVGTVRGPDKKLDHIRVELDGVFVEVRAPYPHEDRPDAVRLTVATGKHAPSVVGWVKLADVAAALALLPVEAE